jgi:hypothetical protein
VWPQKCDRCLHHKPPLDCSKPEVNNNVRGKNKDKKDRASSTSNAQSATASGEPEKKKEEHGDLEELSFRPLRTTAIIGLKREHPLSPRPSAEPTTEPVKKVHFPKSAYLKLESSEFRILVLAPGGKNEEEVRFSFIKASMSDNPFPDYEAVSQATACGPRIKLFILNRSHRGRLIRPIHSACYTLSLHTAADYNTIGLIPMD